MDLDQINRVGMASAYAGGKVLKTYFEGPNQISKKGITDLVTEADVAAEKAIISTIRRTFPDHSVLAEESGASSGRDRFQWIIDPLDGTTNFAHRLPFYAVSIAFMENGQTKLGMVLNPVMGELFYANAGRGAWLNNKPIEVSSVETLIDALLITGFPYETGNQFEVMTNRFTTALKSSQGMLRLGSAALDLCYVACGRSDGFWQHHLNPWDTAGGALIVTEAGGQVTDLKGDNYHPFKKDILATNGRIHNEMLVIMDDREQYAK